LTPKRTRFLFGQSIKFRRVPHHSNGRFISKQADQCMMKGPRRGRLYVYELTGPGLHIDAVLFDASEISIQGLGWPPS